MSFLRLLKTLFSDKMFIAGSLFGFGICLMAMSSVYTAALGYWAVKYHNLYVRVEHIAKECHDAHKPVSDKPSLHKRMYKYNTPVNAREKAI